MLPAETYMAASQWLRELSIHRRCEEAAVGSMGEACQRAHRKPIEVRTKIFRGADNHCGARTVGTILGKKKEKWD